MSTTNAFEQAALPTAKALVQALIQFVETMGTDPAQWALKFPGALQVLEGQALLQLPVLEGAEAGALSTATLGALNGLLKKIEAQQTPTA